MEYADLVGTYERLDATEANLELIDIVAEALAAADDEYLPLVVKLVRGDPFAAWQPEELGLSSNLTLEAIARATGVNEADVEARWRETGDLGSAAAWAVEHERQQTLVSETLTVKKVHDTLQELATYEGEGSQGRRIDAVAGLIADADPVEAKYVVRTVLGHLRLGVGEGIIREAIAEAFLGTDAAVDDAGEHGETSADESAVRAVERAFQVTNDYREVAERARDEGVEGLQALEVTLGRPLGVMLAAKADGLADAFETVAGDATDDARWGEALLEYKLDGFRIQIHKSGEDVTVFTRRQEDVTAQFPDVVERARQCLTAEECIVEGEVLAYDAETGEPLPFQDLSQRIKRKYDVDRLVEEIPVGVHLFDVLSLEGESYLETPLQDRIASLEGILQPIAGEFQRVRNVRTSSLNEAEEFYADALDAGQEGLVVKNLGATYQPGRRVGYMVKVKPTMEPLDLTVVKAEWSEGRRSNNLGRLFLGCRDPESDEFLTVGRLSTGFTDEELAEITERLEPTILREEGREVTVEPLVVIEVEYEEIQESPEYESGYALRFPRFLDFRDDLSLSDVDTVDRVESLFEGS